MARTRAHSPPGASCRLARITVPSSNGMMTNAIATSRPISGGKPSAATGPEARTNTSAASAPGSRNRTSRRPVGMSMTAGAPGAVDGIERDRDVGGGHPTTLRSATAWRASGRTAEATGLRDPAARRGPGDAPRAPSSRSGARRRCRRRCRRGSTRGTAAGRATRGRRGTSRCSRRPAGARRRRAARSRPGGPTGRRPRHAGGGARPDPVGYSTVKVSPSASSQRSIDSMNR